MKALLIAVGGRGKVEPFLALAGGLQAAGHGAVVAAPGRFSVLASAGGVPFAGLDDSLLTLQEQLDAAGVGAPRTPYLTESSLWRWLESLRPLLGLDPDVVVAGPRALGAPAIAEKLGVPLLPAQLTPAAPATAEFAAPTAPSWTPRVLYRWSWKTAGAIQRPWRSIIARWRVERLGLSPQPVGFARLAAEHGVLSAWSRHLLPAPADWPASAHPLGFWTLPASDSAVLPQHAREFLTGGAPPVLVILDDLYGAGLKRLARSIAAGLGLAGRRGLLVARGSGLEPGLVAEDLYLVDQLPFPAVMPHVAAVVHHGSISTIAAALTAGAPQVTNPSFEDQLFWARRLHRLGIAPEPLDRITGQSLADGIEDAIDRQPAVTAFREALGDEDGVAAAITRIENACRS
ncbi:MAG: glycosyltransferase family 1 protein [Propionibacteriaceae bacterium]|nr:glycosyltransferase [Actinomycetota bacterium]MCW5951125.1 glycosyltransferase family 1 protein [Propionibacteriaceae bacterium]